MLQFPYFNESSFIYSLRQLFWTDWGLTPKVERADLDGGNRTTLVSTDIAWPTGVFTFFSEMRFDIACYN